MNLSQLKYKMRDNQHCIQHSLSKMHSSLNQFCCQSPCCQSPVPQEQSYHDDDINYKLNRLKLQNKVLKNELNRK